MKYMFERYTRCPVCNKRTRISVPEDALTRGKRFPIMLKVRHHDHHFYISIDSRALIMDIKSPELVE